MTIAPVDGRDAGDCTCERGPRELLRRSKRRFGIPQHCPDRSRELQERNAGEQDQEPADPAFPLVVIRPRRPVLIGPGVVQPCLPAAGEPGNDQENPERDAGQRQEPLPRSIASVGRLI